MTGSTATTLNIPKGRWGGSVNKSPRLNDKEATKKKITTAKVPETATTTTTTTTTSNTKNMTKNMTKNNNNIEKKKINTTKKKM